MELTIKCTPNEIAALILAVQGRQETKEGLMLDGKALARQVSHEISRQKHLRKEVLL